MFVTNIVGAGIVEFHYLVAQVGQDLQIAVTAFFGNFTHGSFVSRLIGFYMPFGQAYLAPVRAIEQQDVAFVNHYSAGSLVSFATH